MKYFFLLAFITLIDWQANAQSIKIANLIRMHSMNADQIESFAFARGFNVPRNSAYNSEQESTTYAYHGGKGQYRSISIDYYLGTRILRTDYTTLSAKEYSALKNEIKQLGYVFSSKESNEKVEYHIYKKQNSKYEIHTLLGYDDNTGDTHHVINVVNRAISMEAAANRN